jgi:hypothetical protein
MVIKIDGTRTIMNLPARRSPYGTQVGL